MTRNRLGHKRISLKATAKKDSGSILLLAVVYIFLSLLAGYTLWGAVDLYLARKDLQTVADMSSLAAVNELDFENVKPINDDHFYNGGIFIDSLVVHIDHAQAISKAKEYINSYGLRRFERINLVSFRVETARVIIELKAQWHIPGMPEYLNAHIPLSAISHASATLHRMK